MGYTHCASKMVRLGDWHLCVASQRFARFDRISNFKEQEAPCEDWKKCRLLGYLVMQVSRVYLFECYFNFIYVKYSVTMMTIELLSHQETMA